MTSNTLGAPSGGLIGSGKSASESLKATSILPWNSGSGGGRTVRSTPSSGCFAISRSSLGTSGHQSRPRLYCTCVRRILSECATALCGFQEATRRRQAVMSNSLVTRDGTQQHRCDPRRAAASIQVLRSRSIEGNVERPQKRRSSTLGRSRRDDRFPARHHVDVALEGATEGPVDDARDSKRCSVCPAPVMRRTAVPACHRATAVN